MKLQWFPWLPIMQFGRMVVFGDSNQQFGTHEQLSPTSTILRDFKNAPFYILCRFHMIDLRMFSYHFLSSCKMDYDLP